MIDTKEKMKHCLKIEKDYLSAGGHLPSVWNKRKRHFI